MTPDLHHLSGAYAIDALDEGERADFERHLDGCAACRTEVAELRDAAHALAELTDATPPPAMREAVLGGIRRVRPEPPPSGKERESRAAGSGDPRPTTASAVPTSDGEPGGGPSADRVVPLRRRATTWLAAAAAAVVLAVGGLVWHPWAASDPSTIAAEQVRRATDAATVTTRADGVGATLAYSRELDRSAIDVSGLAPAPSGTTYQLWYLRAAGDSRSAGLLSADSSGHASAVLLGEVGDAESVGVTLEPAGGSPAPTSDPLVVLAIT